MLNIYEYIDMNFCGNNFQVDPFLPWVYYLFFSKRLDVYNKVNHPTLGDSLTESPVIWASIMANGISQH